MQIHAPFEAYRGEEPYLFVSYAHKDSDRVYPILKAMHERGWRMWYDEGIDPGNEWTAFIESALTGCGQVLSFISPNAVESLNCRQEINLAIDDRKAVLAVHLEETELKYGLRLRMSAFQAVLKYRIDSDDEFFRALDRGLDSSCRTGGAEPRSSDASASSPSSAKSAPGKTSGFLSRIPVVARIAAALAVVLVAGGIFIAANRVAAQKIASAPASSAQTAPTANPAVAQSVETSQQPAAAPAQASNSPAAKPADSAKKAESVPAKSSVPKIPKDFVKIDGGSFVMGTPAKEVLSDDNEKLHKVSLSPYYIAKHELTQAEWVAVMGSNPSAFKGDSLPVESVSWYAAIAYCNKRSLKEGLVPCYTVNGKTDPAKWGDIPDSNDPVWDLAACDFSANGYRLPTEAEWEYACRADTRTAFFTGANITTDQANYTGSKPYNGAEPGESRGKTVPVGSFAANAYGLFDMSGNVWEWCNDWYGPYAEGADPAGPADGASRIVRGGSWDTGAQFLRSGVRGGNAPQNPGNDLGFRLAFRR